MSYRLLKENNLDERKREGRKKKTTREKQIERNINMKGKGQKD